MERKCAGPEHIRSNLREQEVSVGDHDEWDMPSRGTRGRNGHAICAGRGQERVVRDQTFPPNSRRL